MVLNGEKWSLKKSKENLQISCNQWNGNTTFQNLQDSTKATLRRKHIVINAFINKQKNFKLTTYQCISKTKKNKSTPNQNSRRKEIIKIRTEINDTEA
jgi:hypothetical protein